MIRLGLLLCLMLPAACKPRIPDHGTFVGNPGSARIRAATADGLQITEVELSDGRLVPADCEGIEGASATFEDIDGHSLLDLPTGSWCALSLTLQADTLVYATGDEGGSLTLPLDVASIDLSSDAPVDLQAEGWILELGGAGWTSAEAFGVVEGADIEADPHSAEAEAAAAEVARVSGLYADLNLNGEIDEDERDSGPVMRTTAR